MDYKSLANFAAARKVAKEAPSNYRHSAIKSELEPTTRFDQLWDAIGVFGKVEDDTEMGCVIQAIATTETGVAIEVWLSRLNVKDEESNSRYNRVIHSECYDEDEIEIGPEERIAETELSGKVDENVLGRLASLEGSFDAVRILSERPEATVRLDYSPKE